MNYNKPLEQATAKRPTRESFMSGPDNKNPGITLELHHAFQWGRDNGYSSQDFGILPNNLETINNLITQEYGNVGVFIRGMLENRFKRWILYKTQNPEARRSLIENLQLGSELIESVISTITNEVAETFELVG